MKFSARVKQQIFSLMRRALKLEYGDWSYSQEGEDLILCEFFHDQMQGFYVDVGAFHPRRFSNTFRLYKRGWCGINIDPTPGSMKTFRRERPRDVNLEVGISTDDELLMFYQFGEPALNTFSEEVAGQREKYSKLISRVDVKTRTLQGVLEEFLPRNTVIDFLDVDVEGKDLEVLQSNDWDIFRPRIVLIEELESLELGSAVESDRAQFLMSKGYRPVCKTYRTVFFLEESFLGTITNAAFAAHDGDGLERLG
jgi:FkbM family methyltransferase